jgi:hypothetical protein
MKFFMLKLIRYGVKGGVNEFFILAKPFEDPFNYGCIPICVLFFATAPLDPEVLAFKLQAPRR